MKQTFIHRLVFSVAWLTLFLGQNHTEAVTLIQDVLVASQSNVVFSDIGGGIAEATFNGLFDFASIGGVPEAYSGTFSYDTSVPPFSTPPDPNVTIAIYELQLVNFSIFGNAVTPLSITAMIHDGDGIFNDFFTFQVTLDSFDGAGLPIPGTSEGLIAIGLNAGAFPGTMFSSADFPLDLDVFAAASGAGAPTQFAVLAAPSVPEPSSLTLMLLGFGGIGFATRSFLFAGRIRSQSL